MERRSWFSLFHYLYNVLSLLLLLPHTAIQNRNPVWYQALTHGLNEEQRKQLQDIATLADQRRAAHGMLVSHTISNEINDFRALKLFKGI